MRAISHRALVWSSVHRGNSWGDGEGGGGSAEWGQDETKRELESVGARSRGAAAAPAQRGAGTPSIQPAADPDAPAGGEKNRKERHSCCVQRPFSSGVNRVGWGGVEGSGLTPPPRSVKYFTCQPPCTQIPSPALGKVSPWLHLAMRSTPCSLISLPVPIARLRPPEIAFNYSCLFSTNTSEMELANKQWQTTLILVCGRDPLMHQRSGRLLTGTCYCLRLLPGSNVDTVNMFTGATQP